MLDANLAQSRTVRGCNSARFSTTTEMNAAVNDWIARARSTPIESVILARGIPLRRVGAERIGPCPKCGGTDRFSINVKEGVWNCRGCKPEDISGDVIGLVEHLDDCGFEQACETLTHEPKPNGRDDGIGLGYKRPREVAWFDYFDEDNALEFQVVKYEPKDFRPRHLDENGRWIYSKKGVRDLPYRLPELLARQDGIVVYIVEGEKDVETLVKLGCIATTNAGGCNGWKSELNQFFKNADIIIIGDHDPQTTNKKTGEKLFHPDGRPKYPGWDHAMHVAEQLAPIAHRVRIFDAGSLYGLRCPDKCDITDWIENGGSREELDAFVDKCPDWKPNIAAPAAQPIVLPIKQFKPRPFNLIPVRPLMHAAHFFRRRVVMTVAPGGYGKTALDILNAVEMVLGVGLIGPPPIERPLRVLYWDGEDTEDEVERRLAAICIRYKLDRDMFEDRLHLGSRLLDTHRFAEQDRFGKVSLNTSMLSSLQEYIGDNKIDCTIFDPLIAFHQIKESDNLSMELLIKSGFERFSEKTNSCTELAQHTRKASGIAELTVDDARGAGATSNAARSVRLLNRMTTEEARTAKIESEARRGYLRLTLDKVNYIPPQKARWIHLANVQLPNAANGRPGDNVQVVEPYGFPQPMDGVTSDDMFWARDLARSDGSYRKDSQSDKWFGYPLAKRLKLDAKDKADKAKLTNIIKAWLDNGALAVEERPDKQRKMKEFIVVGPWTDEAADDPEPTFI